MARHYSKVLIAIPDKPGETEIVVTIDCDTCGETEVRFQAEHFGTLVRVLSKAFASLGGDDGTTDGFGLPAGVTDDTKRAREYLDRMFPDWKAKQLKGRHGAH